MRKRSGKSDIENLEAMTEWFEGPRFSSDLLPSEVRFATAMHELRFGRFRGVRIERGELVLDPWPTAIRDVKFGSAAPVERSALPAEAALKRQVTQLFGYVRSLESGEIELLEIHDGLPVLMRIRHLGEPGRV